MVVEEETDQTEIDEIGKTGLVFEKSQKDRDQEEMLVVRDPLVLEIGWILKEINLDALLVIP